MMYPRLPARFLISMGEEFMKNDRKEIGGWVFTVPEKVIKLGLVCDNYKMNQLQRLWKEAEEQAVVRLKPFDPKDFFFEESYQKGELTYSFRYYTPKENRSRMSEGLH